jgi:hypothetical protein
MGEVQVITVPSQAASLPDKFKLEEFRSIFHNTFSDTSVTVETLVNLVYIFRKTLSNFKGQATTIGRVHQTLY